MSFASYFDHSSRFSTQLRYNARLFVSIYVKHQICFKKKRVKKVCSTKVKTKV